MARIRTIKPQFFLNEELAEIPSMARLLFIGLWTQADREGRLLDRPKRLKAEIFPYDNYDIEKGLNQLSDAGFIFRYKVNANGSARILAPEQPINELALIQIINFSKHQKIDKINERESDLPEPELIDYEKTFTRLPIVQEGKGREKEGKGKEDARAAPNINFSVFWDLYDKKVGEKEKLEKKWLALTDIEREKAIQHIPKYKISQPEKKFRKDPATYLNNKSFNDEIINDVSSTIRSSKVLEPAGDREREDF